MTKEEVLALQLTPEEKERVEKSFSSADTFGRTSILVKCTNEEEAKKAIAQLQKSFEKRKEAEKRKADKIQAKVATYNKVVDLLDKAINAGFSADEVIKTIEDMIREKHNAELQAQIAALQAQLL